MDIAPADLIPVLDIFESPAYKMQYIFILIFKFDKLQIYRLSSHADADRLSAPDKLGIDGDRAHLAGKLL